MTEPQIKPIGRGLLAGLLILPVVLWLAYWGLISGLVPDFQTRGQFGDMFGGINALFAGLAFAGLLYTIALQRNELALQRTELALTREELRGQKDHLEAQNKTLHDTVMHEVLVSLSKDYRSVEMMVAIRGLWDLRRDHAGEIAPAYERVRVEEAAMIAGKPPEQRLALEKATLHFQRRVVSQFYQLLAGLYELQIIPPHLLFTYWGKTDLSIIPEVLLPIEEALSVSVWGHATLAPSLARMRKLYEDAPPDQVLKHDATKN